jgi:hypothetical protein
MRGHQGPSTTSEIQERREKTGMDIASREKISSTHEPGLNEQRL